MSMRIWPFPGDSPVARSRKVALAYRAVAQDQHTKLVELQKILAGIDVRIIGWIPDAETITAIQQFVKTQLPDQAAELDERFSSWGEQWHATVAHHWEPDDWINAEEAAALVQIGRNTLLRARSRGRIEGQFVKQEGDHNGRWYFKVADVYALQEKLPGRDWKSRRSTSTLPDTGEVTGIA